MSHWPFSGQSPIDTGAVDCILRTCQWSVYPSERLFVPMGRTERQREIARRRKRKTGLTKLRAKFAATTNEGEKAEIVAKARRMSPFVVLE